MKEGKGLIGEVIETDINTFDSVKASNSQKIQINKKLFKIQMNDRLNSNPNVCLAQVIP